MPLMLFVFNFSCKLQLQIYNHHMFKYHQLYINNEIPWHSTAVDDVFIKASHWSESIQGKLVLLNYHISKSATFNAVTIAVLGFKSSREKSGQNCIEHFVVTNSAEH